MTTRTACPQTEQLLLLAEGRLDEGSAQYFERHFLECVPCFEWIREREETQTTACQASTIIAFPQDPAEVDEIIRRMKALRNPNVAAPGDSLAAFSEMAMYFDPAQAAGELGRLGAYRVLRLIGRGGMGVVYEAEDTTLGRKAALKNLQPSVAQNPAERERFLREARLTASLRDPRVAAIYHVGEACGLPYLAMELLQGESLDARLSRDRRLPIKLAKAIAGQIAQGLAAAHAAGLMHRDIKPANIWLERKADNRQAHLSNPAAVSPPATLRVKILDFGLARPVSDVGLTQSGTILGTPLYMAPEQARGETVDQRADLFSLGAVLYRSVTGQTPFQGKTPLAVFKSLDADQPPHPCTLNAEIPRPLGDLIVRLLAVRQSR